MMDAQMQRLETLCFDYEDATIESMLTFATELRDRRLRYCRERHLALLQQREALAALSPPTASNNQRVSANSPPPNPPCAQNNQMYTTPTNQPRNFDPNTRINTGARNQFAEWNTPQPNSANINNGQVPPQLRVIPPTPTSQQSPTMPTPLPPPLPGTQNLQVPRPFQYNNNDGTNSSGGGSEMPPRDCRGQSTPTKQGSDGRPQFPPARDGALTISDIRPGGSSQSSPCRTGTSYGPGTTTTGTYGPGTTRTTGTDSYAPGTTGPGPAASNKTNTNHQHPFRHSCTMMECPICQGELRVCLTPLCEGGNSSSNRGTSSSIPTTNNGTRSDGTTTTTSGSSNSRPSTEGTLYQVQFNTDVSMNTNSSGSNDYTRTATAPTLGSSLGGTSGTCGTRGTSTNPSTLMEAQYNTDVSLNTATTSGGGGSSYPSQSQQYQSQSPSSVYPRDTTGNESCPPPFPNFNGTNLGAHFQQYNAFITRDSREIPFSRPEFLFPGIKKGIINNNSQSFKFGMTKKRKDDILDHRYHIEPSSPQFLRPDHDKKKASCSLSDSESTGTVSFLVSEPASDSERGEKCYHTKRHRNFAEMEKEFELATEKIIAQMSDDLFNNNN